MITNNLFTFNSTSEVQISNDLSNSVLTFIEKKNYRSVALIVDEVIQKSQILVELRKSLTDKKVLTRFKSIQISEPTTCMVDDLGNQFSDSKMDLLIGIGGGKPFRFSKSFICFYENRNEHCKKTC